MRKGLEYEGVANLVPGAQSIPVKTPRGVANAGSGGKGTGAGASRGAAYFTAGNPNPGITHNDGGAGVSVVDLSTVNADTFELAYSFPGGATDDNIITWKWIVPKSIAANPKIVLYLHVLAE
jgi:hypothetical protein